MNKKFFLAALTLGSAALASTFSSAPAKAVTADVPIEVNVPEVVFLETYDKLTFDVTVQDLTGASSEGVIRAGNGTVTLSGGIVSPGLGGGTIPAFNTNQDVTVLVYKTWGLGGVDGNIRRTVTYNGAALEKGTSSIGVTVAEVDEALPAPGLDYGNADDGNVDFGFNFTNVKQSGLHEGGTLTITATAE